MHAESGVCHPDMSHRWQTAEAGQLRSRAVSLPCGISDRAAEQLDRSGLDAGSVVMVELDYVAAAAPPTCAAPSTASLQRGASGSRNRSPALLGAFGLGLGFCPADGPAGANTISIPLDSIVS